MIKQLLQKFSAFIVIAMLFSASANAQIVYTDVNPDVTITQDSAGSASHDIDINNDSIADVAITAQWVNGYAPHEGPYTTKDVWATTSGSCQVLMDSVNNLLWAAKPVNYGNLIDATNHTWAYTANARLVSRPTGASYLPFGAWTDTTDRYLAIRIKLGGNWFYGWIRVSVSAGTISFTIRDYAYNSIPNQPIFAGQTTATGITENSLAPSINLFPNPFSTQLTFSLADNVPTRLNDEVGQATVSLYNFLGQQVLQQTFTNSTTISTEQMQDGIYFYELRSNKGSLKTGKLVKQ